MYLPGRFEVFSIILPSFRQLRKRCVGGGEVTLPQKVTPKKPTQIRVKTNTCVTNKPAYAKELSGLRDLDSINELLLKYED